MPLTGDAKRKYDREHKRKKRGTTTGTTEGTTQGTTNVAPSRTELEAEVFALRAEVARLKQLLAQRPKIEGPEIQIPPRQITRGHFVSPFSRAAQASLKALPNLGPMGRMARGEA